MDICFIGCLSVCFLFPHSLLEKIEQETWRETGVSFVTSVTRLMERLLDYRSHNTDNTHITHKTHTYRIRWILKFWQILSIDSDPQYRIEPSLTKTLCHVLSFVCVSMCGHRDCMKGDETENKKIGCTVNLLVGVLVIYSRVPLGGVLRSYIYIMFIFIFFIFSELLQVRDQQGRDVHPLHPQTL